MKEIIISVTVAVSLVLIAMFFSGNLGGGESARDRGNPSVAGDTIPNVTMEDGKQVITIAARGGYSPRLSVAKAGVPTIIRMKTSGTFDCSSALSIPSLNLRLSLPSSGTKDIEVPPQQTGSALRATCAMGMYNFEIQFN